VGIVFPGGGTRFVFGANRSLPAQARVPIEGAPVERGLVVGLWQGADITSSDRQMLGVIRIPPHLFQMGGNFALGLTLMEDLSLKATFQSSVTQVPLLLEGPQAG
jgi:hypothetical protein